MISQPDHSSTKALGSTMQMVNPPNGATRAKYHEKVYISPPVTGISPSIKLQYSENRPIEKSNEKKTAEKKSGP